MVTTQVWWVGKIISKEIMSVFWRECNCTLPVAPVPPVSTVSFVLSLFHSAITQLSHAPTRLWGYCPLC